MEDKDKNKISLFKKWRKQGQSPAWIRAIQVIGVAATLVLIYSGATSLIRLNSSYIENTFIPSQKIHATATPEAKSFALTFSRKWLVADGMQSGMHEYLASDIAAEKLMWPRVEQVEQVWVRKTTAQSQYTGDIELEASVRVDAVIKHYMIHFPIRYIPEHKSYQVSGYPEYKEMESS
ncbi:hypothetical protein P9597_03800 [Aneurinibacillus migulanus]|uniref:hypothetical protein n=1 Tax=Aneurinibacillus migulanus TaxID=47500 RepID=UPI002E20DAD6|nr:hypothetical protein [Aneurinibacillus migulanus]